MSEKSFVERVADEVLTFDWATNKACQTCLFAHGEVIWFGEPLKLEPDKCFCLVYNPDESNGKPKRIAFDGAPCKYYEKDDSAPAQ